MKEEKGSSRQDNMGGTKGSFIHFFKRVKKSRRKVTGRKETARSTRVGRKSLGMTTKPKYETIIISTRGRGQGRRDDS